MKRKPTRPKDRYFVNQAVEDMYRSNRVTDPMINVPALQWRSPLSRITPKIARQLERQGSSLLSRK